MLAAPETNWGQFMVASAAVVGMFDFAGRLILEGDPTGRSRAEAIQTVPRRLAMCWRSRRGQMRELHPNDFRL